MGFAPSTMQGIRSRAPDVVCPKSGVCVCHVWHCHWFAPQRGPRRAGQD